MTTTSKSPPENFVLRLIKSIRNDYCIFPEKPPTPTDYSPDVDSLPKIKEKIELIKNQAKIEETLEYCKSIYLDEEARRSLLEGKATILAGFAATSTAGILALFGELVTSDRFRQIPLPIQLVSAVLATIALLILLASATSSVRALAIKAYHRPDPKDIFELTQNSVDEVKKKRASSYFHAYVQNHYTNSRKADAFVCGLNYFRLAILCLGILILVISSGQIYKSVTEANTVPPKQLTMEIPMPESTTTTSPAILVDLSPTPSVTITPELSATMIPTSTQ